MERRGIPKKTLNAQRSTFNFSIPDSQPFVPALEYLKVELLKVESFQRVPGEGVHSMAVSRAPRTGRRVPFLLIVRLRGLGWQRKYVQEIQSYCDGFNDRIGAP